MRDRAIMDASESDESVADALIRRAATVPYAFPLETNRLRTLLAARRVTKADLAADARRRAQISWAQNKGVMAAYWKAVGAYATHIRRALRA